MLSSVVVHDHMGSVTTISFENVELSSIDDTIFTFEPPEGAEIIRQMALVTSDLRQKKVPNQFGMPKEQVDSEVMVGQLRSGPFELIDNLDDADVIVVNTCSFIQPATEGSIQTVLDGRQLHRTAQLVVTGCMVQRYGTALGPSYWSIFLGYWGILCNTEVLSSPSNSAIKSHCGHTTIHPREFAERLPS